MSSTNSATGGISTGSITGGGSITVVAIDGPAGSGKSSVSRAAARALGFDYLDTGAAYRALAWHCIEDGVDLRDESEVVAALPGFDCEIGTDPDAYFVRVGAQDITTDIREPRVTARVSAVARIPEVRAKLTGMFRRIIAAATSPGIVVEGRDITTVVAPDAAVRILLTASPEARTARRSAELTGADVASAGPAIAARDRQDSSVVDFMNAAAGVTTLDSTDLDFEETVQAVVKLVKETA